MPKYSRLTCPVCGVVFVGHPGRVYCSDACHSASLISLDCEVCGAGFLGKSGWKFCSDVCRKRSSSMKSSARALSSRKASSKYGDKQKELILRSLSYDPETGVFTWIEPLIPGIIAGDIAGSVARSGYLYVGVNYFLYQGAVLAVLFKTGDWPPAGKVVDHIDRDPLNNRWSNLRVASLRVNCGNKRCCDNGLPVGVKILKDKPRKKPFHARIGYKNEQGKHVRKSLGYYATAEEAGRAYLEAAAKRG